MQERCLYENLLQRLCRRVTDGGRKQQITLEKHGVKTAGRRRKTWTDLDYCETREKKKTDRRPTTEGTGAGRKRGETRIWREGVRKIGGDGGGGGAEVS